MKKLILFLFTCAFLFGCTETNDASQQNEIRETEVFVYAGNNKAFTRSIYDKKKEEGYSIPNEDGTYDVWYYIRIDGNIPGENVTNNLSNQYFPQTVDGKTLVDDLNHGTVKSDAIWDRSITKNFPLYIYDGYGSKVSDVIVTEPTLDDLLNANKSTKYDLSGYLEHKDELHFIWYTCKQQKTDHIWHIDGVLTSNDRVNISQTEYGSNVEVDIHQQEHKDWNEIKTSIHLRDTVDIDVIIPIESDYICEADDFDVRVSSKYEYVENFEPKIEINGVVYTFVTTIEHRKDGIHILIKPNSKALVAARLEYDDGITFEIHNYVTGNINTDDIWSKLRKSSCVVNPKSKVHPVILNGQITSAYNDEVIRF